MKRVLVYASSGYLGSAVCMQLKGLGHYVIGLDIPSESYCPEYVDEYHKLTISIDNKLAFGDLDGKNADIIIDCSTEQLPRDFGFIIPTSYLCKRGLNEIVNSNSKPHYVFLSGDDAIDVSNNEKLLCENHISNYSVNRGLRSTIIRLGEVRGILFEELGELVDGERKPNTIDIHDVMDLIGKVVEFPAEGLFHTVGDQASITKMVYSWSPVNTYSNNKTIN